MFTNDYIAPASLDEIINILSTHPGAKIIAGGTDLLVQMRNRMIDPSLIVDMRHLPFKDIKISDTHVIIGSRVTYTQIVNAEILQQHFPEFVLASQLVGGPPIRNLGTLGGNLVNASPAADTISPLLIYDAKVVIAGKNGQRRIPLSEFYIGYRQTQLNVGEIVQSIELPLPFTRTASHFIKYGKRRAQYIAALNVAVRISLSSKGLVETARIALGCVGPTVFLVKKASEVLEGKPIDEKIIAESAKAAQSSATPISDVRASAEYRSEIVAVLVRRALTHIVQKLEGTT